MNPTQKTTAPEFTGFRAAVWPIHRFELKKFLPMGMMMLCTLFIYTILRDTKDAILVNAPGSGAEVLSFAKGIGVTFSAIIFMLIYAKASNIFNREGLFYATALPFLVFFGIFPYFIYPNREALHMSLEQIVHYQETMPMIKWIIPLIGNWSYTLFYILSELWGSAVLSLLFWQFANAITPLRQAKRFYSMFGFVGNFGLVLSGPALIYFSSFTQDMGLPQAEAWGLSLKYLMALVILAGIILFATFYWMNRNVLTDKLHYDPEEMEQNKKGKKAKLSLTESLLYIARSPYLGLVAVVVLAYGVSINLFEGVWKGQIKIAYPNENDYNAVMGGLSTVTGLIAMVTMLIGSNILRKFSWRTAALITPVALLLGIFVFFAVIIYNNSLLPEGINIAQAIKSGVLDPKTVVFAVMVGLFANAFGKAVKYSLFDSTKEMAYIPLDPELKIKGKAAVDIIGGRGGKSGGSYIQMGLLTIFSGSALYQLVPIIAPIVLGVVLIWIWSVFKLNVRYLDMIKPQPAKEEANISS